MVDAALDLLLIEDDTKLADLTAEYLKSHGATVSLAPDGPSGLTTALTGRFDAILLDLMLPGMDGIEVCRRLRERTDVPIIMLTARGEEADKVLGLEIGADDYMPKPFSPRELLARVRSVVRRARGRVGPEKGALTVGDLTLDPERRSSKLRGIPIELTSYEFSLLFELAKRAGRVLSREQLIELAGGSLEESFDRSVDVHISKLRQKLGDDPQRPRFIKTIRSVGYLFVG